VIKCPRPKQDGPDSKRHKELENIRGKRRRGRKSVIHLRNKDRISRSLMKKREELRSVGNPAKKSPTGVRQRTSSEFDQGKSGAARIPWRHLSLLKKEIKMENETKKGGEAQRNQNTRVLPQGRSVEGVGTQIARM